MELQKIILRRFAGLIYITLLVICFIGLLVSTGGNFNEEIRDIGIFLLITILFIAYEVKLEDDDLVKGISAYKSRNELKVVYKNVEKKARYNFLFETYSWKGILIFEWLGFLVPIIFILDKLTLYVPRLFRDNDFMFVSLILLLLIWGYYIFFFYQVMEKQRILRWEKKTNDILKIIDNEKVKEEI